MAGPITQAQLDALTAIKVTGEVSSNDMAALGQQIYFLREWVAFLDTIDWTKISKKGGGPTTATPPPPPKWPP